MADYGKVYPHLNYFYSGEAIKVNFYLNDTTTPIQNVYGSYYRVESSDTSVATVDKDGYIVGVGPGEAQIRVYLGNSSSYTGYGYAIVYSSREPNNTRYLDKTGLEDFCDGVIQKVDDKALESTTYRISEEQKVGEWIDGKPIYRKTVSTTTVASDTKNISKSSISSNLEKFVKFEAFVRQTNSNNYVPMPYYASSTDWCGIYYSTGAGNITIKTGSTYGHGTHFVTVYYTKTTDPTGTNVPSKT